MRRLYIGGLSHSVTQKDLKDRFGKFGEVHDVELRTKKDEEGVPYKTFSYINIDISEADLKKCMTVLNKSKWKGGTLQIEAAKESFLHRLAEERQAAMEQGLQPAAEDKRQKLLDSLSKAGVDNFTMKAAVPGTEVPGHKDWVVSKFGRVLPTLQLRCKKGNKARTLNYDPSKYSHNIRKLDKTASDPSTPVTQLTWEMQGGDDDISKKRRGEFPPYKPPPRPKKSRTDLISTHNAVSRTRLEPAVESANRTEKQHFTNGCEPHSKQRPGPRKLASLIDSDSDEEIRRMVAAQNNSRDARYQEVEDNLEVVGIDYLGKLEQQKGKPEDEDDYDSADTDELFASKKPPPPPSEAPLKKNQMLPSNKQSENNTDGKTRKQSKVGAEEEEEDLKKPSCAQQRGDSGKPPLKKKLVLPTDKQQPENNTDGKKKTKKQSKVRAEEEEEDLKKPQRGDSGEQNSQKQCSSSVKQSKKMPVHCSSSDSDDELEENEDLDSADSSSDSDYDTMFSNVTRLEISFTDLQRLAEESQPPSEPAGTGSAGAGPEKETGLIAGSVKQPAPKKGIMPEEILASIMDDDSSDDEKKKKKKKRKRKGVMLVQLPAFLGTNALNNQRLEEEENEEARRGVVKKHKLDSAAPQVDHANSEEKEQEDEPAAKTVQNGAPINREKAETSSSSSSDDVEGEVERMEASQTSSSSTEGGQDRERVITVEGVGKSATPAALQSESTSEEEEDEEEEDEDDEEEDEEDEEKEEEEKKEKEKAPSRVTLGAKEEAELQRKANVRRLAAIQQRQKEAEEHKRLIQGALANLDTPNRGIGKRIVFGSDDDDDEEQDGEDESKQQTSAEVTGSKKTALHISQSEDEESPDETNTVKEKVPPKQSASRLFGGSEDEEDDDDGEEDNSRFNMKPQFEGRAGQKLMELQSRFATDERFRMDSRFLEEVEGKEEESEGTKSMPDEDETLDEERKKNLSILQSVLGSVQQTCSSKTPVKAKTFRDVSALHYDPSREEHAAFETKPEETKESKSARRKKREEAQKLPEVTKEIYYDVSGDLKAVFGQTKDDVTEEEEEEEKEEEEKTSWDQKEEEKRGNNEEPTLPAIHVAADPSAEKQESGFKFSFFGEDAETETKETKYKVETIQAPKVSWQQDPRFQDSSSDEEEQQEEEEQSSAAPMTTEEATPSTTSLFFFFPEDSRLTEGPRLFCRPSQLEEQREQWEERRSELRQEYRKKHKDARRKLKASLKS